MIAGARDLYIVFSRVPANITTVLLVRWNHAAAWRVFARLRFSIRHVIFLSFCWFSAKYLGLPGFLIRTAIAPEQTRYRNSDVQHAGYRLESGHHARDGRDWNHIAVTQRG